MGRGGETLIEDWNPQFAVTGIAPRGKVGRARKPTFLPRIRLLFNVEMRRVRGDIILSSNAQWVSRMKKKKTYPAPASSNPSSGFDKLGVEKVCSSIWLARPLLPYAACMMRAEGVALRARDGKSEADELRAVRLHRLKV
jgi:hypothetical protein